MQISFIISSPDKNVAGAYVCTPVLVPLILWKMTGEETKAPNADVRLCELSVAEAKETLEGYKQFMVAFEKAINKRESRDNEQ